MFDIIVACNEGYIDAADFALPSWIKNADADRIYLYTDGKVPNKWGGNVVVEKLFEPSNSWIHWCNVKPTFTEHYINTHNEGDTFLCTDLDCYCLSSWREGAKGDDWWVKSIRADKTIIDHSNKEAVAIIFGRICERTRNFVAAWKYLTRKVVEMFPEELALVARHRMGGNDQATLQWLIRQDYKDIVHLNENIWSSERDDYEAWKRIVDKYKYMVKVLHFKGGRWKDPKIVKEIFDIVGCDKV